MLFSGQLLAISALLNGAAVALMRVPFSKSSELLFDLCCAISSGYAALSFCHNTRWSDLMRSCRYL